MKKILISLMLLLSFVAHAQYDWKVAERVGLLTHSSNLLIGSGVAVGNERTSYADSLKRFFKTKEVISLAYNMNKPHILKWYKELSKLEQRKFREQLGAAITAPFNNSLVSFVKDIEAGRLDADTVAVTKELNSTLSAGIYNYRWWRRRMKEGTFSPLIECMRDLYSSL